MTDIKATIATITAITELRGQLADVKAAAEGDSNDAHISSLRDACETALSLQGLSFDDESTDIGSFITAAKEAAEGDSNDDEIDAYQDLLSEALDVLDLDDDGNVIPAAPETESAPTPRLGDFTVLGVWDESEPIAVGVVPGDLPVTGGDEDHFNGIWAISVQAENAEDAEIIAINEMSAEGDDPQEEPEEEEEEEEEN
ncbi:hypothetical protein GCM10025867_46360 (plasmid) [Frondihabitans sucicola]|uniref:Uncharacterized protein n=1 Tax=Frondihabitans sucicola TaxID=1268041 RepID=A0ABN6Y8Z7_9MICO|nr:hypothetical protein [Frondihabitans sucicola]BDZ52395.1 hypothetical protein GCM10025867_46360 [Frondihabitans sucicola]